ncbi:MAG TPA: biotin--[acetyl-CoA-carboxylase] ligase [Pirellulales bacterium]|nr:biotin--[acetyl-CoA-carboxylase] ligase [Pirellulales bacterium]
MNHIQYSRQTKMFHDEINLTPLRAARLVDRLEYHESLTSTNDYLREVAARVPRSENMLVIAERQTAGRGRGANRWWTGPESLAFSLLFDPATRDIPQRSFPLLSLAAAVALIETVAPLVGSHEIGLHWPNDVFAAGRKLAGILVEALPDGRLVLGIGCNVNHRASDAPAELADTLVTLADLSGKSHDRTGLLLVLLERLDETFDFLARSPTGLGRRANALCLQHGRKLTLAVGSRQAVGLCAGIAEDGALLLDTATGRERFYSGVILRAGEEGKKM